MTEMQYASQTEFELREIAQSRQNYWVRQILRDIADGSTTADEYYAYALRWPDAAIEQELSDINKEWVKDHRQFALIALWELHRAERTEKGYRLIEED